MANTADNLKTAFAGESKASTTYLTYARKAEHEGQPQAARLFRAASMAETVHARNHLEAMEGVKSTEVNLKEAIAGENHEHIEMYPRFITQAENEENANAVRTFDWARKVEIIHESLYKAALEILRSGGKLEIKDIYVCQVCGCTVEGEPPEQCPVCGAPQKQFLKVA